MRLVPMHMADWIEKLNGFLTLNDRDILTHAGRISHEMAQATAELEYAPTLTQSQQARSQHYWQTRGAGSDFVWPLRLPIAH